MAKVPQLQTNYQDGENLFKVKAPFIATGDQPKAIESLVQGLEHGQISQVLLGATGTGKTFTIAKTIERVQKPTLVIAHNKTLAAQLASEFKEFFPDNAVEYFVSYYDYYQPEAYIAHTDTYIEKDASINDEIDKLRHSATCSLFERRDVIIVASVSCIYGLGSPDEYQGLVLSLRQGQFYERDAILRKLVSIQYERNDINFVRGKFRVRGDVIEIFPAGYNEKALRIELFGDEIERILETDALTGEILAERKHISIYPASHYVTSKENMLRATADIEAELEQCLAKFKAEGKLLEAQRLEQRTRYDLEMMLEMGYCSGVENYSRHLTKRAPGESPFTLIDYFPDDFLIVIDESHVTLPQIRAMYAGDRARKEALVNNGFRLPSAFDNRPLRFEEFNERINQIIYVSATPAKYELEQASQVVQQIIRPTGLIDPAIVVKPLQGQMDDLLGEIKLRLPLKERVLVTTLTKKMAENLTDYLKEMGIKVRYLHSDIVTLERAEIIRDLRMGVFDVLIGINLLREGLDLPEVSLVAILDADKEGFLRSDTSLIQTIGRAARNANGKVIMYADNITDSMKRAIEETKRRREIQQKYNVEHNITDSMKRAIEETKRRREIQQKYNVEHNITPQTIQKTIKNMIETTKVAETAAKYTNKQGRKLSPKDKLDLIDKLQQEMQAAAKNLQFELAANLRDMIIELKGELPAKKAKNK